MIMKMFKSPVLISFFLAFTTTLVHAKDSNVVTDVNGNELRSGDRYYMKAVFASPTPSAVGPDNPGCPTGGVVIDSNRSRPISITPVKSNSTVILEDTYVTVRFNYSYLCRALIPLVWRIGSGGLVTTRGVEGLSRFKLTKYEGEGGSNKYQLAACPEFDCLGGCRCEPVGSVLMAWQRALYLVAGGNSLPIEFEPVEQPRISYKLPSM